MRFRLNLKNYDKHPTCQVLYNKRNLKPQVSYRLFLVSHDINSKKQKESHLVDRLLNELVTTLKSWLPLCKEVHLVDMEKVVEMLMVKLLQPLKLEYTPLRKK
jgi:hypothetical protein